MSSFLEQYCDLRHLAYSVYMKSPVDGYISYVFNSFLIDPNIKCRYDLNTVSNICCSFETTPKLWLPTK